MIFPDKEEVDVDVCPQLISLTSPGLTNGSGNDRIGAEIDKRVDTRLGAGARGPRPLTEGSRSGRRQAMWTGAGVGAGVGGGIIGIVAVIANSGNDNNAVVVAVVAVWLILAVLGLGTVTVLARKYRSPGYG